MREIKFRAWDKDVKKFADMCAIHIDGDIMASSQTFGGMYDFVSDEMADRIVLQQYTGIKDKNGVEIYEGDILTGEFGKDTVELEEYHLDGGGTAICYVYSRSPLNQGLVEEVGIEVIGNIYENPDLLK